MFLNSNPHIGYRCRTTAPTLTELCEKLEQTRARDDSELRSNSIYGPLRLKTEVSRIGIRARRAEHRENAALYVYRSLNRMAEIRADILGIKKPTERLGFIDYLKGAWEPKVESEPITKKQVLQLKARVEKRCSLYEAGLSKKEPKKFAAQKLLSDHVANRVDQGDAHLEAGEPKYQLYQRERKNTQPLMHVPYEVDRGSVSDRREHKYCDARGSDSEPEINEDDFLTSPIPSLYGDARASTQINQDNDSSRLEPVERDPIKDHTR